MNQKQFVRRLRKYCRKNKIPFNWDPSEGDGSHGTVYVGSKRSIVQHGELPNFYTDDILDHFGIPRGSI